MASVAKLSRDRRKKNAPYYIQFFDHTGRRRTTKGCSDKGVTEAKAAKIETLVEKIKTGLAALADLEVMLGHERVLNVQNYLDEFQRSLERKNNTHKHVRLTMTPRGISSHKAEGTGLEPATPYGAPHLQ